MQHRAELMADSFLRDYKYLNKYISTGRKYYKPKDNFSFLNFNTWLDINLTKTMNIANSEGFTGDYAKDKQAQLLSLALNKNTILLFFGCYELATLATWRYTKGVYKFSKELQTELLRTEFKGNMPVEVFDNFPEYSVCLEFAEPISICLDKNEFETDLLWVTLMSFDDADKKLIIITAFNEKNNSWDTFPIPLDERIGLETFGKAFKEIAKYKNFNKENKLYTDNVRKILPFILYLVSDKPDIKDTVSDKYEPTKIQEVVRKGEVRLFPANKVKVFNAGQEFASRLHKYYEVTSKGGTVKPHIRRGHWHTYWTGKRDGKRTAKLQWLFPIFVNEDKIV